MNTTYWLGGIGNRKRKSRYLGNGWSQRPEILNTSGSPRDLLPVAPGSRSDHAHFRRLTSHFAWANFICLVTSQFFVRLVTSQSMCIPIYRLCLHIYRMKLLVILLVRWLGSRSKWTFVRKSCRHSTGRRQAELISSSKSGFSLLFTGRFA